MENNLYLRIGRKIKKMREQLGISQEELANIIDRDSAATISHFELGLRKISVRDLQKIANHFKMPIDAFFELSINTNNNNMQHFNLRASNFHPSARQEVAEFIHYVHNHGDIYTSQLEILSSKEPQYAAEELLKNNNEHSPPVFPRKIAQKIGISVVDWNYPDGVSGMFVIENKRMNIGVNQNHSYVRQRFTIAHEIGHFIYRKSSEINLDFSEMITPFQIYSESEQRLEVKANRFAANLLMPKKWIIKDFKINGESEVYQLARKYEVSEQSMWYRLLNLNLVNRS